MENPSPIWPIERPLPDPGDAAGGGVIQALARAARRRDRAVRRVGHVRAHRACEDRAIPEYWGTISRKREFRIITCEFWLTFYS